ncbi:MAG: transglutaminase-like cysteine peptidase [Salinarimonas sp.]|nr:transglutaminase-like cysteine peptidase [Salinarimonas sp.]
MIMAGAGMAGCVAVALAAIAAASPAAAQQYASLPDRVSPLQAVGTAQPIPAWRTFCERHPIECNIDQREAREITLTPQIWELIVRVNRTVNAEITPMTDMEQWGVADSWDFPKTGYGDCEDYQLLKRHRLAEAGLPRRAMRMTVVLDTRNEGHAVLEIKTDRGIFILDNVTDEVLPWDETPYVYIKREGRDDTRWVSLGGVAASPTAVAGTRR